MKLVSRKVPKTLEDETVSLLPEDPEDMVSKPSPLFLATLKLWLLAKLNLRPCSSLYRYPSPTIVVTPSSHPISTYRMLHLQHSPYPTCLSSLEPLSVPDPTDLHRL